jgi:uncharacterized protein
MGKPFLYGKLADGDLFINRQQEIKQLSSFIDKNINCTLIAPRRWGKSSLVKKLAEKLSSKKTKFCFIDLYNVRTEEEFIQQYSNAILQTTSNNIEDAIKLVSGLVKNIIPKITLGSDNSGSFEFGIGLKSNPKQLSEVLDLPNKIAQQKNIQLVICIDEFQNISHLNDGLAWQKKLRAHWQKHQHCSYLLYGSKRHLMLDFFTKSSMPFYKFGELVFLDKIKTEHWIPFLQKQFAKKGKSISETLALQIVETMENHPYAVQQFAMAVWHNTKKIATAQSILVAIDDLLDQYGILYQKITDELSTIQLNYLHALLRKEINLTASATLQKYQLGASATVIRTKEALEKKEIIDIMGKSNSFNDPLFSLWLKERYFKLK